MPKLTTAQRKKLPAHEFAIPTERKYPIEDEAHARNALARVAQHGTPAERMIVQLKVRSRFPTIDMPVKGTIKRNEGNMLAHAYKDWTNHEAYVDANGNYRLKIGGKPIAPWNAAVKEKYGTNSTNFHNDAEKFKKHLPEKLPLSIKDLQSFEDERSLRSRNQDERRSNQATFPHTESKEVQKWMRDQGSVDIVGVDAPRKVRQAKMPQSRAPRISHKMPKLGR